VWESTAKAERAAVVSAAPERAWSVLRSPEAWVARRKPCLTFSLPGSQTDGLRFYLAAGDDLVAAGPDDVHAGVLETSDEVPGQMISLRLAARRETWQLSVEPGRRGTRIRICATRVVPRVWQPDWEAVMLADLKVWLARLQAIAEGRAAMPGPDMSDELRQACTADRVMPPDAITSTAAVVIEMPPARVWREFRNPAVLRAFVDLLGYGDLPGTTPHQPGAMNYLAWRNADGMARGVANLTTHRSENEMMTGRNLGQIFAETTFRLEAAAGGTRLELTLRCPGRTGKEGPQGHLDRHTAAIRATADKYKAAMESLPRPSS